MISVFTTFIRRLGSDRNGLDKQLFASVWNRLRGVLISELKARGLWNASPRYLGVVEGASWSHQGALEELLAECYSFIFVRRIHALHTQLQSKDNIDGLVFRNVRNFLTNEQKKHDPLGFRVFHVVRSAVQRSIANASLFVSGDGLNIRNGTVLQFHAESEAKPAVSFEVATHIQAWSDELLPELVTARGAELESVVEKLRGFLVDLRAEQIRAFRLKDVVDPLKRDVRHRWERLWSHSEGETARDENEDGSTVRTRIVYQVSSFEERQEFEALFACVTDLLSCLVVPAKTRSYLAKLWAFERNRCMYPHEAKPLSHRKIGNLLGIPRHRLPKLYRTLGQLVRRCLAGPRERKPYAPTRPGRSA